MTAPEEFMQKRWRCPHCRKSWATKAVAVEHCGVGCHKDPATRTCATCRHYRHAIEGDFESPPDPQDCRIGAADIAGLARFELPRKCTYWKGWPS